VPGYGDYHSIKPDMPTTINKINEEQLLLFDGVCNLCNRVVRFIIKRDRKKKFRFAAMQ